MQKRIHFIKSVFLRKAFFIHATEYVQVFDVSLLLLREILDFNVKRLSGSVQTCATETEERCDIQQISWLKSWSQVVSVCVLL